MTVPLLTVACIGLGFLLFLQFLSIKDSFSRMIKNRHEKQKLRTAGIASHTNEIENNLFVARERTCPLCKTALNQKEYLICAMQPELDKPGIRQIHIYGCRHCFIK